MLQEKIAGAADSLQQSAGQVDPAAKLVLPTQEPSPEPTKTPDDGKAVVEPQQAHATEMAEARKTEPLLKDGERLPHGLYSFVSPLPTNWLESHRLISISSFG